MELMEENAFTAGVMRARIKGLTLWSLGKVRKAALSEWGLQGFLPLKLAANFCAVLWK